MVALDYGPWVIVQYYMFMIFADNTIFALAFVLIMLCLLHCLPPHNPCMLLVAFLSLTYVHDSPAHLYMPQLFTHDLPIIICVM